MRRLLIFVILTATGLSQPLAHKTLEGTSVSLDVYVTKVNDGKGSRAWCFMTSGLKSQQLTVTVLMKPGEAEGDYPSEPIKLLNSFALQEGAIEPPQVADLQGGSVFPGMTGILIVQADALEGVPEASSSLSLVPIFRDEIEVADMAGPSRVMGALANQTRYYPCPIWCDRTRTSVFSPEKLEEMKASPVFKAFPYHSDASLMVYKGLCSLRIGPETARVLSSQLYQHKGLRLGLEVDPRANAFLIWTPENEPTSAVNPHESDGSKMSGQFLLFVPGQKQDECRLLEDGYALLLTDKSYQNLAAALKKGGPYSTTLSGSGEKKFALDWVKTAYYNPIEKTVYTNKKGWVSYNSGASPKPGVVSLKEIVLLTPDQELGHSLGTDALTAYIKALEAVGLAQLKPLHSKTSHEVLLQCEPSASPGPKYLVAIKPPPAGLEALVKNFYAALATVKVPTTQGPAKFHLIFTVKPH